MLLPYPIDFPNEIDGLGAVPREILIANHFVDYLSINIQWQPANTLYISILVSNTIHDFP